jgi:branched-chain amino acid aminotransferase group I
MSTPFLWHNGRIKPWAEANVHVSAHALHYGSSVFEGERVYATPEGPAYFRLADHTRRLFESARVYEIDIGYSERDINEACLEVIRANRMASAYVRPIVFRGAGGLGVLPRAGAPVDVAILALEWGAYLGDAAEVGADVCVSSWHRPAPNTIPSWAKAGGNYLSSQLIGLEDTTKALRWERMACSAKARAKTCSWSSAASCSRHHRVPAFFLALRAIPSSSWPPNLALRSKNATCRAKRCTPPMKCS